jgi:hypothetical protein
MFVLKTVRPPGPLTSAVQFLHCCPSICASTPPAPPASFHLWNSAAHAEDWIPGFLRSIVSLSTGAYGDMSIMGTC